MKTDVLLKRANLHVFVEKLSFFGVKKQVTTYRERSKKNLDFEVFGVQVDAFLIEFRQQRAEMGSGGLRYYRTLRGRRGGGILAP